MNERDNHLDTWVRLRARWREAFGERDRSVEFAEKMIAHLSRSEGSCPEGDNSHANAARSAIAGYAVTILIGFALGWKSARVSPFREVRSVAIEAIAGTFRAPTCYVANLDAIGAIR